MVADWQRKLASGGRWSQAEGRSALEAWRISGESLSAFARRHGFQAQRLVWWRQRFESSATEMTLLPVTLSAGSASESAVRVLTEMAAIEVLDPERVSSEWIAALVVALSGVPSR